MWLRIVILLTKLFPQLVHIPANLFIEYLCIDLCRFNAPVAKHFTYRFNRNIVCQGDGCGKSMPCHVEGDIFSDTGKLGYGFQVQVHLLVAEGG